MAGIINYFSNKLSGLFNGFNHKEAQVYELDNAKQWISQNFKELFESIEDARTHNKRWPGPGNGFVNEFFKGDMNMWEEFSNNVSGKTCLDIGGGPCSVLCIWYWIKIKIILEPLAVDYKNITLRLFNRTWFTDDIKIYTNLAEDPIPELKNAVDGAIICRNSLDHCKEPYKVLANIADYSVKGCYLLLWTDLWHKSGHDKGHTNITRSVDDFEKHLRGLGFSILNPVHDIREGDTINYGCLAVRN